MSAIDPSAAKDLLEAFIAAFAVLGGVMAYFSGFEAFSALASDQTPDIVTTSVNEGLAQGFAVGVPAGVIALMIMAWG